MAEIDWNAIEGFIGFGNPKAPVLFLGFEEGLQRKASLQEDLASRSRYRAYEDLQAAQLQIGGTSKFFGDRPKCQRTWRAMCHLMLRREGIEKPMLGTFTLSSGTAWTFWRRDFACGALSLPEF